MNEIFVLKRALRQALEFWDAAGVAELPPAPGALSFPRCSEDSAAAQASDIENNEAGEASAQAVSSGHTPAVTQPAQRTSTAPVQSGFPQRKDEASSPRTWVSATESLFAEPPQPPSKLAPEERATALKAVSRRVAACTRCAELAACRTQTVFGVGDPSAKLMFLGEAPGADEDRTGVPFVGKAGQLLDRIISACTWKREDIYICNILRCRPPNNRNPSPEEARNCREYLDEQIQIVDPDYIVCWGSVAARNLLETTASTGRLRGRFHQYGRSKVLCTYHPSYLLRNPAAKKDVWEDMKFLMTELGIDWTRGG